MKKLTAFFASFALILCLCFSAVACNKQDASKIAGTYKLSSMTMTMGGATVTLEAGKDADMVLLDDELNVVMTVGLGRVIYTA